LADIMDFDRSRTPASVFQHLRFTEDKSWEEWNKHLQVRGWHVDEHEVLYSIPCSHPAFYVAVMEFLDWIDAELRDCRHLVKEAPNSVADRYELNLPAVVDRRQVEMEDPSYLAGAFRFQLDYERIMQLLMDRSLYPDPSLFLRELLQNALDACRTREAHAKAAGATYTARIAIWDHSDDPDDPRIIFQDNGIGMSRRIVENYFMRVGRSYYKSVEFDLERQRLARQGVELEATSQFGIGILSCFMVADRFDVETYRSGNRPLHITIEGPTKYFTIRMLPEPPRADFAALPPTDAHDGPPNHPGTRITVHLNPGSSFDTKAVLEQFAVNIEYEIRIHCGGLSHIVPVWRWRNLSVLLAENQVGSSFRGHHEYRDGIAPVLNTILTPAKVPLEEYDFASHLDGCAWFWLLRGPEGNPCPAQGFLRIGTSLQCTGLAALAGALLELEYDELLDAVETSIEELIDDVAAALSGGHNPFESRDVPVTRRYSEVDPRFWERLYGMWETLPEDQKPILLDVLADFGRTPTPWYADENAPGELLAGTVGWAERNVATWPDLRFGNPMNELSLHGIRLPAGVVSWDPMRGSGKRKTYLAGLGGIAVDLRRGASVKPAASRLFIDQRDAAGVEIPLLRACIRFGSSLASKGGSDAMEWRRWLGELVVPMFHDHQRAAILKRLELPGLEETHGYLCTIDGLRVVLSREELVTRFNSSVPFPSYGHADEGIDGRDPLNELLVSSRIVGKGYTARLDLEQDLETVLSR
jgi:hypothetical protein